MTRYAHDFFEAAKAIDDSVGAQRGYAVIPPIPAMYCMGRAFELMLKGYLLHRDITLDELRSKSYGHELHRLFRKAKELGLGGLHPAEEGSFALLDALYASKQLEYIVTGMKTFPAFGPLEHAAARLFNQIAEVVGYRERIEGYALTPLP
jgi:hypothetical protein